MQHGFIETIARRDPALQARRAFRAALAIIAAVVSMPLAGCASAPKPERSFAAPRKVSISFYRDPDGALSFRMACYLHGAPTLIGSAVPGDDGSYDLRLSGLEWFSNWEDGWTEAKFCATGSLKLIPEGEAWSLSRQGDWRIEYPETARIRYRDTVIDGETSAKQLANRWDRIQALCAYLADKGYNGPSENGSKAKKRFIAEVSKELLPEIYGYPADYSGARPGAASKARVARAEGVSWNIDYTESRFPESLREVRNSGTAYRDWAEAKDLFILALEWERVSLDGIKVEETK